MTTHLLVLSDLHISPPGPLATFHAGPALADFLHTHAHADTTLLLAGDILDLLQIDDRPAVLDMPGAPALMRRTLAAIAAEPWGSAIFSGLAALLRAGGRCVLLPGNHDPELHHPVTRSIFLGAFGLPDHPGFTVHTEDAPWTTVIGGLPVRVGHGHRLTDPFNDIDPEAVLRAVETGDDHVKLPPGSRLVLELLNPLKRAVNRSTGVQRFPFLDLLKPERSTAMLLLPYLDWRAAEARTGTFAGVLAQRFLRRFERAIRRGPVLGAEADATPAAELEEMLADALADELTQDERSAPDAMVRTLRTLLSGGPAPAPGTLAAHDGLLRWCARRYLLRASRDGSFFDEGHAGDEDRAIMARELPEGSGPRIAIFGHTHAARHIDLGDGRVYVNTGTWMDLMKLPALDDDAAVKAWIDRLEAGEVERVRRRTFAEVTEGGAALREWPAG
jgi:UDP-2,3-diacylglucosamine pyrophosphatase LpxH